MKNSRILSWQFCLQLLYLALFFFTTSSSALKFHRFPRLSPIRQHDTFLDDPATVSAASVSEDYETFFYTQTLDHFNYRPESYSTFQQRYYINFRYWGGPNAPIFVYLGAESSLEGNNLASIGFLSDNALQFNALLLYIEHRYYGRSIPIFGSGEEASNNANSLGYFNSAQAIADYAEVILYVKRQFHAERSPVIVVGGSYGGMLASWFRLKYPHIALGALASSAPVLYFDDITPQDGYYSIVTEDFREASESCFETIVKSWSEIDRVAALPDGLAILSEIFHTCRPLNDASELKTYLQSMYTGAAQYNQPPRYPVDMICGGIDGANTNDDDILGKIFSGLTSYSRTDRSCYVNPPAQTVSDTGVGWSWQMCSEMVIPMGISDNTMFPASPFNLEGFTKACTDYFGVPPRPHWITTYYGGHDIKLILNKFGSNIIFSNGLKDPYSSGGVLENISESVLAISTRNGSHCLDILRAKQDDPYWLVEQRSMEVNIIKRWIDEYYSRLN